MILKSVHRDCLLPVWMFKQKCEEDTIYVVDWHNIFITLSGRFNTNQCGLSVSLFITLFSHDNTL